MFPSYREIMVEYRKFLRDYLLQILGLIPWNLTEIFGTGIFREGPGWATHPSRGRAVKNALAVL